MQQEDLNIEIANTKYIEQVNMCQQIGVEIASNENRKRKLIPELQKQ